MPHTNGFNYTCNYLPTIGRLLGNEHVDVRRRMVAERSNGSLIEVVNRTCNHCIRPRRPGRSSTHSRGPGAQGMRVLPTYQQSPSHGSFAGWAAVPPPHTVSRDVAHYMINEISSSRCSQRVIRRRSSRPLSSPPPPAQLRDDFHTIARSSNLIIHSSSTTSKHTVERLSVYRRRRSSPADGGEKLDRRPRGAPYGRRQITDHQPVSVT